MYSVYLIENEQGVIYIGSTQNISTRLQDHNNPEQKGWTKKRGPWKLLYTEEFPSRSEAMQRERFLKNLKAGKRIKDILGVAQW